MHSILLAVFSAIAISFASCISDDFTTSSSDILSFSTDTLSFDTVFTDLGTPTARLKVFNKADKAVNITAIAMANPDSKFSMNVDGMSGKAFQNIEIRANDSIFIFVECKLPLADSNTPQLTTDKIEFLTNGVRQSVVLEAWGQNVTRLYNERITTDTRFTADRPIVVFDSLIVEKGATLTIDPGAQILFHDKASLTVRGRLDAVGKPGKMIDMRGDRLDNVLPDVGYDIMAGQWQGIRFAPESFGNRMEYVDMRSTVQGLCIDSTGDASSQKLLLLNSWLHNSKSTVFSATHANVSALGCCFSEAADHVVQLNGGSFDFTQCTFANYYLFSAPYASIIGLYGEDEKLAGLTSYFLNCIVYGLASDLNIDDLSGSNVFFKYTLFRSGGLDDDNFISCLWEQDPLFYTDRSAYIFNYRVKPDSPAIAAGNAQFVSPACQFDMDGVNRLSAGAPTLGAYQFVEPPKE